MQCLCINNLSAPSVVFTDAYEWLNCTFLWSKYWGHMKWSLFTSIPQGRKTSKQMVIRNIIFSVFLSPFVNKLHKLLELARASEWAFRLQAENIALSPWHTPKLFNVLGSCHSNKFKSVFHGLTASELFFKFIKIVSSKVLPSHAHCNLSTLSEFLPWPPKPYITSDSTRTPTSP